ncbi:uncharacterized protein LOC142505999 [Primulina tabacum]|uniref:uncharacterized protein LOC142505999 n=1 Tax=Primulina tabacum TaxID=48773 RepID=UPI003F5AD78B
MKKKIRYIRALMFLRLKTRGYARRTSTGRSGKKLALKICGGTEGLLKKGSKMAADGGEGQPLSVLGLRKNGRKTKIGAKCQEKQRLKELMERQLNDQEEERREDRHVEIPRRIPMLEYAQPSLEGSIATWEDMAKAFVIKYFPPSKTMKLRADITTFAQFDQESLYEAWERFKDLLRRCPHHELPLGLVVQTFYYGLLTPNRTMIDAAACGNLLRKTAEEGYELLEEMAASSYHPQSERNNQRKSAGVHQVTDFSAIIAQLDALNRKLDSLNVGGTAMRLQEIFCDKCGGEHYAKDYQDDNPFYVQEGAPINKVGVQNRPRNDPYSNTYNPGWRQHPNFSWGGQNSQNKPQGGQSYGKQPMYRSDPPREEKSNLEQMMSKFISSTENRLQNQDASIKGLENQIGQLAKMITNREPSTLPTLCDLGASINLMPLSVFRKLGLGEPKPTRMSLQLADRSVKYPRGLIEDVLVKVDKFIFPVDFVVLDMEEDIEMPLILGRPFLATGKALIDVQEGKLRLRVGEEEITFDVFNALKHTLHSDSCYRIDAVDALVSDYVQDALGDPLEATLTTELEDDDLDEEKAEIVAYFNANPPWRRPMRMKLEDLGEHRDLTPPKSSIEEPPTLELKPLPPHLKYIFLGKNNTLPVIISAALTDAMEEKLLQVLKEHKRAFAWKNLRSVLRRCEETNLVLNWEKCHFMVQKGIVLGHKVSEKGIEVDKAKIEVIKNLPPPASIKGVRSFFGHAGFYRRFIKDFSKISKPLSSLLMKDVPFDFHSDCLQAYEDLKERLVTAPVLVAPDWDLPFEIMCDASDTAVGDVLGQRQNKVFHTIYYASKTLDEAHLNYATTEKELLAVVFALDKFHAYLVLSKVIIYTDHSALKYLLAKKDAKPRLLRLEFVSDDCVNDAINDWFPDEQLFEVKNCPWCVAEEEFGQILNHCHDREVGGHFGSTRTASKMPTDRFGTPRAIISDGGTHFCNKLFEKLLSKYGVTHNISTPYHPQTSGQVEVSNREIKRILEKVVGVSERRLLQLDQLEEFRNLAYDLALSYKEKTKRAHDRRIIEREFQEGENVLLYNSRLRLFPGKLKSRWSGPFVISKVYSSGAVELKDGKDGTLTVNAQRLKHYMGGTVEPQLGITRFQDNSN